MHTLLKIFKVNFSKKISAWIVDSTCEQKLMDRLNVQNKYAGNSFPSYQYSQKIKCSQGKRI